MKNKRLGLLLAIPVIAVMFSSCVTSRSVRYLRDFPEDGLPVKETLEARICPFDELRIRVFKNGEDDELVRPFNLGGQYSNNSGYGSGYLVDAYGNIQFPILGELHVEGLTRLQLQDTILSRLQKNGYVNNPLIIVRIMNFKVYMLTSTGGRVLTINHERCTFLEALAQAGGLDLYTRRDKIGVMREVDGKRVIHYMDPRSVEIFDDDFFVLQQNDIIFTETSSRRFFREAYSNWTFFLSAVTSLASVFTVYQTIKNKIGVE
jgi:polysaccharide export outer membrane protein